MADKAPKPVKARWVCPTESELVDGTVLVPGETVVSIPAGEAEASDNWELVGTVAPKTASGDGD